MEVQIEFSDKFQTYGMDNLYGEPDWECEMEYYDERYVLTHEESQKLCEMFWYNHNFKGYMKDLAGEATHYLKNDVDGKKLIKALAKYGITFKGLVSWSPKEYNFQGDSLDFDLEVDTDKLEKKLKVLKPHLQKYIDEVRMPSQSGYTSFECSRVESLYVGEGRDYGCFVWAILDKEKIDTECLKEGVFEHMLECSYEAYDNNLDYTEANKFLATKEKKPEPIYN